MQPAVVRFIGDENKYILRCGTSGPIYCHLRDCFSACERKESQPKKFTFGQEYSSIIVTFWNGKRNNLTVQTNQGGIEFFIPFEDFEVVSDPDNVLNLYEAKVRCIAPGEKNHGIGKGTVCTALGRDKDGCYLIACENNLCWFYPSTDFEIVDDPHDLLSKESLCFRWFEEENEPYQQALDYCRHNKQKMEESWICGCFSCLNIFDPKEIRQWKPGLKGRTAVCPYCGETTVLGYESWLPITKEFLRDLRAYSELPEKNLKSRWTEHGYLLPPMIPEVIAPRHPRMYLAEKVLRQTLRDGRRRELRRFFSGLIKGKKGK